LLAQGHDVSVITIFGTEHDFFALHPQAHRLALGIDQDSPTVVHGLANNLRRRRVLRNAIRSTKPDIIISHIQQTNIMTLLAAGRRLAPVIVVEHNDPGMNPAGKIWDTLRRRTYPRAAKVVSVSQGVDSHFSWLPEKQRAVIHNPIKASDEETNRSSQDSGVRWITSMGRLTHQKGFDLLLNAFAKITAQHPAWRLRIIGDGPLRQELGDQVKTLDLTSRVEFAGLVSNPAQFLRQADLFVMASRFEGFPYVALEALVSGLPVIYTDCPSGPREIIRDGVDGILVPAGDVEALAAAMDKLMTDDDARKEMSLRAPEVLDRFDLKQIIGKWEDLFSEVSRS
jgi:GalNAc-alpha-(1->4)-GalNAc-alpha-(1->3)-diNAcBac-PP-undecaprenol alpha-1,4-N-acetyl-D-galactosaminyltransferase